MSIYVEVPFIKTATAFDCAFPPSLNQSIDPQTYVQAITRINQSMQLVRFNRSIYYTMLACAITGGALIGYGAVNSHSALLIAGSISLFVALIAWVIGLIDKNRKVRKALDSALLIENDRFLTTQPPVSFRLFEQQVEELTVQYDPNHTIRDAHHNQSIGHHDRHRRHGHGHHHHNPHNNRSDWHVTSNKRIDWKLIVEIGVLVTAGQPFPMNQSINQSISQPQYNQYVQPIYAQPGQQQYVQQQYAQPIYTQQGYNQPINQPINQLGNQPINQSVNQSISQPHVVILVQNETHSTPLIASQGSSDSDKFSPPMKPSTYLSPAGASTGKSYGAFE